MSDLGCSLIGFKIGRAILWCLPDQWEDYPAQGDAALLRQVLEGDMKPNAAATPASSPIKVNRKVK